MLPALFPCPSAFHGDASSRRFAQVGWTRWTLRRWSLFAAIAVGLGSTVRAAENDSAAPAGVDSTVVLRIGRHELSRYAVESNLKRFAAQAGQEKRTPSPWEFQRWFESFLVRQVVIAQAMSENVHARPEIAAALEKMERHVLTQVEGPFYQTLAGRAPTPEKLRELYELTARVPDVLALRLPVESADFLRSPDWAAATGEQRVERLRAEAAGNVFGLFHDGPLRWPFDAFPELEADLLHATPGSWIEARTPGFVAVALVRSVQKQELLPFERVQSSFTSFASRQERVRLRRERKERFLTMSAFAPRREAIAEVAAALRAVPPSGADLPPQALAAQGDQTLAIYRDGEQEVKLTPERWRTYYNQLLLRRPPRTPAQLEQSLQDLVTAEFDLREARALRIDQTPQFIENRLDFLRHQTLDWFEKEKLLPTIEVSDGEVLQRYERDAARLVEPIAAHGRLLTFPNTVAAAEWLQRQGSAPDLKAGMADTPDSKDAVVTRDQPLPGAPEATEILLRLADGQAFGPVSAGSGSALVFVKQSTERVVLPLEKATDALRLAIARERLEELERRRAQEWARSLRVDDRIPYASLGLPLGTVTPWPRGGSASASATP